MSTKLSYEQGPKILVSVILKDGVIQNVDLSPSGKFTVQANENSPEIYEWCQSYASRQQPAAKLLLNLDGLTDFRKQVLCQMGLIPFGHYQTYKELAKSCGCERGSRAIGQACGANPFPLFIPCHRILAAGGSLGGFSQGLEIKKRLLEFENISYL